jgi:hypothetical protein
MPEKVSTANGVPGAMPMTRGGTAADPTYDAAVRRLPFGPGLAAAAAAADTDLVWVLDPRLEPSASALDVLREHADAPAASLPVDAHGAPVEALLGRYGTDERQLLDAARRRRVPLRHLGAVSVLCERALVTEDPDPRLGPYAAVAWTARLFARRPAFLVPASTVVCPPPPSARAASLRMARTGVWGRGEMLRELRRAWV